MSNKYCQALVELRNKPAHELKEVGDQWRTPDNIFWGINTLFGPFVLDLFTDGDNAKCAAYYTAEDNALAHDWSERLAELKGAAFGIRLTANQAYHQMVKLGIVEQRERYSRTAINNIKKFWSLTAKGCMFGKNITSPANPRETQPHFFESRFPELLKLLDTVH